MQLHITFCARHTSPQTSPVFTALLLEPFLDPQMYMSSVFLIFILLSLVRMLECISNTIKTGFKIMARKSHFLKRKLLLKFIMRNCDSFMLSSLTLCSKKEPNKIFEVSRKTHRKGAV